MPGDRKSQVIGRVAVDRTVRFKPAAEAPRETSPGPGPLVCRRCGQVLCEPARVRLFAGLILRCAGCGEGTRA